ncbi:MAG: ankyrin repeat domain-containing protein, partial [Thermoleophilia bacterium]|nr:ankyrin repeat domain-containing protein [Thermoleophilia bacterium]
MLTRGVVFAFALVTFLGLSWMLLGQADVCRPHCPPLHVAARHGDTVALTRLFEEGADVNARAHSGTTPLHLAVGAGHAAAAAFLLDHGAYTEAGAQQGHTTPLFDAASCRNPRASADVTRLLLQRGANPNATVPGGQTPLIFAAMRGRAEVVDLLLTAGASVNARGIHGRTALHQAAKTMSTETVRLLLDAGALVDEQDDNGVTALRLARTTDISELLISRGADVNHLCGDGWTPLMAAASAGDARLVERLLCAGADPDLAG